MIILPQNVYSVLKNQIKEAPTFVFSILDGMTNGTVYTCSASLESILIRSNTGLYYVTGSSDNDVFIKSVVAIFDEATAQNERFTLFSHSEQWKQTLEKALGNRIRKIERYTFTFNQVAYQKGKTNLSSNYHVEKISRACIEQSKEFNEHYYNEYWGSIDNFLQNGFGFVLMENNLTISEGVSIFKSKEYAEIDIVTDSAYRGKGLAFLVAEQFIEYCLSHNIQPCWDCDIENNASIQLAYKLGFTEPRVYVVYVENRA